MVRFREDADETKLIESHDKYYVVLAEPMCEKCLAIVESVVNIILDAKVKTKKVNDDFELKRTV